MKQSKEFENFDHALKEVLKVSHSEIKVKLDAEKAAKKAKKARGKKNDTRNQNNH